MIKRSGLTNNQTKEAFGDSAINTTLLPDSHADIKTVNDAFNQQKPTILTVTGKEKEAAGIVTRSFRVIVPETCEIAVQKRSTVGDEAKERKALFVEKEQLLYWSSRSTGISISKKSQRQLTKALVLEMRADTLKGDSNTESTL